jgi:hypothetical protein
MSFPNMKIHNVLSTEKSLNPYVHTDKAQVKYSMRRYYLVKSMDIYPGLV